MRRPDDPNISIHPGVVNGRRMFPLSNTAKQPRKPIRAASRLAARIKDWQETCAVAERMKTGSSKGYRKPGSMKP